MDLREMARQVRSHGADGDSVLAHISVREALDLARRYGGDVNPHTGLPQFDFWKRIGHAIAKPFQQLGAEGGRLSNRIESHMPNWMPDWMKKDAGVAINPLAQVAGGDTLGHYYERRQGGEGKTGAWQGTAGDLGRQYALSAAAYGAGEAAFGGGGASSGGGAAASEGGGTLGAAGDVAGEGGGLVGGTGSETLPAGGDVVGEGGGASGGGGSWYQRGFKLLGSLLGKGGGNQQQQQQAQQYYGTMRDHLVREYQDKPEEMDKMQQELDYLDRLMAQIRSGSGQGQAPDAAAQQRAIVGGDAQ